MALKRFFTQLKEFVRWAINEHKVSHSLSIYREKRKRNQMIELYDSSLLKTLTNLFWNVPN